MLIAGAGDVADAKNLAKRLIANNGTKVAVDIYRAVKGDQLDREYLLVIAEKLKTSRVSAQREFSHLLRNAPAAVKPMLRSAGF
ncbi:hypothetical protein [Streptomyces sp. CoH17]|uniref:hypothetical protein n=1 Tax=Streptomyces sp. CoH17 TaxID=2992806 RepID=UPI0022700A5B|nr:hypothetical protein [Streptomyces sp. CoH17]